MTTINVFTWNMQRTQSLGGQSTATGEAEAVYWRKQVLETLCGAYDVGFIIEPGQDLRDTVKATDTIPELSRVGTFYMAEQKDNQHDPSACRPVVYIKNTQLTLRRKELIYFSSGGEDAIRFPAAVTVTTTLDKLRVLLVALHATSGYNAAENLNSYLDQCHKDGRGAQARAVIVGGDFNCRVAGTHMPPTITHQSGHILDGFFAQALNTETICDLSGPVVTWTGHPYEMSLGEGRGFMRPPVNVARKQFFPEPLHLSDHCPVTGAFEIRAERRDESIDQANIVTGKRVPKPKQGFGGTKAPPRGYLRRDEPYNTKGRK